MRKKFVDCAKAFIGVEQGSPRHKEIVDTYNSYLPHPRGHALTYTEPWCAAFVSAMAILCGMTDVIPVECSCGALITLWKAKGRWQEADDYRPSPGDILFYDWQDGKNYKTTDNTGAPDHVGIVVWTNRDDLLVIEGNKGDAHQVGYREMNVNGRYIRGYAVPDYAPSEKTCTVELPVLCRGDLGEAVKALQTLLNLRGAELDVDGSFGPLTKEAVLAYKRGGIVDAATWAALIKGGST